MSDSNQQPDPCAGQVCCICGDKATEYVQFGSRHAQSAQFFCDADFAGMRYVFGRAVADKLLPDMVEVLKIYYRSIPFTQVTK